MFGDKKDGGKPAASGMVMLLRQFGFDPELVKTQVMEFQANLIATFQGFHNQLTALFANDAKTHAELAFLRTEVTAIRQLQTDVLAYQLDVAEKLQELTTMFLELSNGTRGAGAGPNQTAFAEKLGDELEAENVAILDNGKILVSGRRSNGRRRSN